MTVTNTQTGEEPDFPAAEVSSGVIERTSDGHEILKTVDGLLLELDGAGGVTVLDQEGVVRGPGIFMVIEVENDGDDDTVPGTR